MEGRCRPILIWEGAVSRDLASATSASLGAQWWIARDAAGLVARSYEVVVSPTIYLIDPQKKVTHAFSAWQPLLESQLARAVAEDLGIELAPPTPPDPAEARRRSQSNLYFRMGRAVASQGLWEEALTHFEQGLAIDPNAPDPLAEAARAAFVTGQLDQARAWAVRSLDLQSTHPLALAVIENLNGHPMPLSWEAPTTTTTPSVGPTPRPTPAR
jgi:tetratricopeptide (TPR) repeat protein